MSRFLGFIFLVGALSSCINNYQIYVLADGSAKISAEHYIGREGFPDTVDTKNIKDDNFAIGAPENDFSTFYQTGQVSEFKQFSVNNETLLLEFKLKNIDSLCNYFYPNYQTPENQPLVSFSKEAFVFSYNPPEKVSQRKFNQSMSSLFHFTFCFYFESEIEEVVYSKNLKVVYDSHAVSFSTTAESLDYTDDNTFIDVRFKN